MQAIVSLFPFKYSGKVRTIWQLLDARFGLNYIPITPIPHFTWQLGESYQQGEVIQVLDQISLTCKPLKIIVEGPSFFEGEKPVVFLKIMKTRALNRLHKQIWQALEQLTERPSALYAPGVWQPHITLAHEDLTEEQLGDVMTYLEAMGLNWRFSVDNFVVLCQNDGGTAGIAYEFKFGHGFLGPRECLTDPSWHPKTQ